MLFRSEGEITYVGGFIGVYSHPQSKEVSTKRVEFIIEKRHVRYDFLRKPNSKYLTYLVSHSEVTLYKSFRDNESIVSEEDYRLFCNEYCIYAHTTKCNCCKIQENI